MSLYRGSSIFTSFWIYPVVASTLKNIKMSAMPGREEGISGSTIVGFNIGISKKIDPSHLEKTITVLKYMISKETQKKYLKNFLINTAIFTLYDDEDVCTTVDCEFFKSLQPIARPGSKVDNYHQYSRRFRNYVFDYLYGNETEPLNVLEKIDDITKIHEISIDPKQSIVVFIMTLIVTILGVVMILSLAYLFMENYNPFFEIITADFWMICVLGSLVILSSYFLNVGHLTENKCHINTILKSLGITLNFVPILCRLVINFPEENKISVWTNNHQYTFFFIFLLTELVLDGLIFISPYSIEEHIVNSEIDDTLKNFQTCHMNNTLGKSIIWTMVLHKIILFLMLIFLIFVEWNIKTTYYDLKFITTSIYADTLLLILLITFNYVHFENHVIHFLLYEGIVVIVAFSNYLLLYGFRVILGFFRKQNNRLLFINKINQGFIDNESRNTNSNVESSQYEKSTNYESQNVTTIKTVNTFETNNTEITTRQSIMSKLINFHYQTDSSITYKSSKYLGCDDTSN